MAAISRALHDVDRYAAQKSQAEKVDFLSRRLQYDAGSAFRNPFRHDHELGYGSILEDVVERAAAAAKWSVPKVKPETDIDRMED